METSNKSETLLSDDNELKSKELDKLHILSRENIIIESNVKQFSQNIPIGYFNNNLERCIIKEGTFNKCTCKDSGLGRDITVISLPWTSKSIQYNESFMLNGIISKTITDRRDKSESDFNTF
jgi:hypothetical protein